MAFNPVTVSHLRETKSRLSLVSDYADHLMTKAKYIEAYQNKLVAEGMVSADSIKGVLEKTAEFKVNINSVKVQMGIVKLAIDSLSLTDKTGVDKMIQTKLDELDEMLVKNDTILRNYDKALR